VSDPASPAANRRWSAQLGLAVVIVIVASVLRVLASRNDLWLDEIWTLLFVRDATSPLGVFTEIRHDNNHYLNSLWVYAFRGHDNWAGFRGLSVLSGIGTVVLAGTIAARIAPRARLTAMALAATSYVLVVYASEARGYAPMLLFALGSFVLIDRYLDQPTWGRALGFSATAVLGMLSHLLFLHFYAAAGVWTLVRLWRRHGALIAWVTDAVRAHAIPLVAGVAIYAFGVKGMNVGGGVGGNTGRPVLDVYAESLAWTLSPPPGKMLAIVAAMLAVTVLIVALWHVRRKDDLGIFFGGAIVVVPLAFFIGWPVVPYVRYFLVPIAFLLVLLAVVLTSLYDRGKRGRMAYAVVMVAIVAANARPMAGLLRVGRGEKTAALAYIASHTATPEIAVAGNHDLRVGIEFDFYAPDAFSGRKWTYYDTGTEPPTGPEWLIFQAEPFVRSDPPPQLGDANRNVFRLAASFPATELSGLTWHLYHNERYRSSGLAR
jgi:hypothetical protein